MNTRQTISVIIPAYNSSATLGTAIDSVLRQTVVPDEIVVVDDGSPENLAEAVNHFSSHPGLRLLRKPNGGASSARNYGIEHSQGELIAFLDSDDVWESTKIEQQLAVLQEYPEVAFISAEYYEQEPSALRKPRVLKYHHLLNRPLVCQGEQVFEVATCSLTSTIMLRRSALGQHRFDESLTTAEDRDLWIRIISEHPCYRMSDHVATVVLTAGSLSRSNIDTDYRNMLRVIHRHQHLLRKPSLRNWEARVYSGWSGTHLAAGRPRQAFPAAWRWFCRQPFSRAWRAVLLSTSGILTGYLSRKSVK